MQKVIYILFGIFISFQVFSQEKVTRYGYKVLYDYKTRKDSSITLLSIDQYTSNMNVVSSIAFGPEREDSCQTRYFYDSYGNIEREEIKCSNDTTKTLAIYQYSYEEKGQVVKMRSLKKYPFFELFITEYIGDTTVTTSFSSEDNERQNSFEYKDLSVYSGANREVLWLRTNRKGDTIMIKRNLFVHLIDTSIVRSQIRNFCNIETVNYLNDFDEIEIIDYFSQGDYKGYTLKKYNNKNKLAMELEYSTAKKAIIFKAQYIYNNKGHLLKTKKEKPFESTSIIYKYDNRGETIREDYLVGDLLDHSIIYKYKR